MPAAMHYDIFLPYYFRLISIYYTFFLALLPYFFYLPSLSYMNMSDKLDKLSLWKRWAVAARFLREIYDFYYYYFSFSFAMVDILEADDPVLDSDSLC